MCSSHIQPCCYEINAKLQKWFYLQPVFKVQHFLIHSIIFFFRHRQCHNSPALDLILLLLFLPDELWLVYLFFNLFLKLQKCKNCAPGVNLQQTWDSRFKEFYQSQGGLACGCGCTTLLSLFEAHWTPIATVRGLEEFLHVDWRKLRNSVSEQDASLWKTGLIIWKCSLYIPKP